MNSVDPDRVQNVAFEQGLYYLTPTQRFYIHSRVVKWIVKYRAGGEDGGGLNYLGKYGTPNLSKFSVENEIVSQRDVQSDSAPACTGWSVSWL